MNDRFALPFLALALLSLSACAIDRDHNPPGPRGGPGSSPDRILITVRSGPVEFTRVSGRYYFHPHHGYWHARYGWWNQSARCWVDRDDNPPGRRGGRGTNWENPPGLRGGPGTSPDRFGRCR